MRCHEARIRIEAGDLDNAALTSHLGQCAACSQLADAERRVAESLQQTALSDVPAATPFEQLRQRIERAAIDAPRKERNLMSRISHQVRVHPRLSFGFALTVAVFLFATLVPFSYERIVGYDATVAFAAKGEGSALKKVDRALESIGRDDVKVNVQKDQEKVKYHLSGFASESEAMQAVLAVNVAAGTESEAKIKPVSKKLTGSLLARAIDNIISIKVENSKGASNQELEQMITAKVLESGLLSPKVTVTTEDNGSHIAVVQTFVPGESKRDSAAVAVTWQFDVSGAIDLFLLSDDSSHALKAVTLKNAGDTTQTQDIKMRLLQLEKAAKGTTVKTDKVDVSK